MAKSKGRLLAELLASDGKIKESKSALDISGGKLAPSDIPTLPNSKLENSSITIAGESTALGSSVSLNTGHITEHTNFKYHTDARVRAAISASGDLSYNSSTGVISFSATGAPVVSVNGTTGSVVLDTGDIAESGNLYFTNARVASYLSSNGYATQSTIVGAITDSAPATLDTLNELAAALGDDANFSTTVTNSIATKLPLAGGTITGTTKLNDSIALQFGTDGDGSIHHDGSHFRLRAATGNFNIQTNDFHITDKSNTTVRFAVDHDGATSIRYNGVEKLATTSTGIDVTGVITTDGMTTSADINFGDDDKALFGAGNDLKIYHSANNQSYIHEVNADGSLFILGTHIYLQNSSGQDALNLINGNAFIKSGGATKLQTSSTGISVTGNIVVSGTVDGRDIATDGTKLDGIEAGATTDQTQSEINALGITATGLSGTPNITLGNGTSGARFEKDGWIYDTGNQSRFYFETGGRTFYRSNNGHQFRTGTDATDFNISNDGHIHIASNGDSQASSTEYIKAGGNVILSNARHLTVASGAVSGNLDVATNIRHEGDTDTKIQFTDGEIDFFANGVNGFMTSSGGFVVNPNNGNYDFIVRGDNETNLIYADGSTDRVGIGTATPSHDLDIYGASAGLRVMKTANDAKIIAASTTAAGWVEFQSPNYYSGLLHVINGTEQWALGTLQGQSHYTLRRGRSGNTVISATTDETVGIGIQVPSDGDVSGRGTPKLHVLKSTTQGVNNLVARFESGNDNDNTGAAILINHSNDRGLLIEGGRGASDRGIAHFGIVNSGGTNTRLMTLHQDGSVYKVGIGTEAPAAKLDVEGGALGGTTGNSTTAAIFRAGRQNLVLKDTRTATGTDWNNATFKMIAQVDSTDHQSIDFVNDSSYNEHIDIRTGNQVFNTRFTHNGRVGIGTNNPSNTLHVNGGAEFNGEIYAKDSNSATDPTYAFTGHTDTGMGMYHSNSQDQLSLITDGVQRAYFNTAGITSFANVYTGSNAAFRNYGGVWSGTTGVANNGFYFLNTANSNTTKAMELSHDGNVIFAGTITGTTATASAGTNTTALASTAFVQQEITSLIGGAPTALDTLNELAAAINDDSNYNTTLTTALATKLPLAGGTMTGNLNAGGGINGLTLSNGISGNNFNITGVNQLSINDPGEGISFGGGSNTVTLFAIDDSSDNIMNFSGAAELRVNNSKVWTQANDGSGSGLDADTIDSIQASQFIRNDTGSVPIARFPTTALYGDDSLGAFASSTFAVNPPRMGFFNINNSSAENPAGFGYWQGLHFRHNNQGSTWGWQLAGTYNTSYSDLYFRQVASASRGSWYKLWHTGNDGSGSGLDADLLDGQHGSYYQPADTTIFKHRGSVNVTSASGGSNSNPFDDAHTETRVAEYGTRLISYTGASATMLTINTGGSASVFQIGAHYNGNDFYMRTRTDSSNWQTWKKLWHAGNDGSGSGLDADTLDGQHASAFAPIGGSTGRFITGGLYGIGHGSSTLPIWQYNSSNPGYGIAYTESSPDVLRFDVSNNLMSGTADLELRPNELKVNGNLVWHAGNDGPGSGLDADLLDGVQGASFLRSDANDTATGQYTFSKVSDHAIRIGTIRGTVVGSQSGEYIQMYNRVHIGSPSGWGSRGAPTYGLSTYGGADFATDTGSVTISGSTAWHAGNDGSGSGLDADLLDGVQGASYLRSDATDVATGKITLQYGETSDLNSVGGSRGVTAFHTANVGGTSNRPDAGNYATGLEFTYYDSSARSQLAAGSGGSNNTAAFYVRSEAWSATNSWTSWYKLWHTGNDGSGSGLDADTLDGVNSASFLRSDASDNYTSGTLTFNAGTGFDLATGDVYGSMRVIRNNKASSDGMYIGYLNTNSGMTRIFGGGQGSGGIYITGSGANDVKYNNSSRFWHAGNDGSGSGLDADLLDGLSSEDFLRLDSGSATPQIVPKDRIKRFSSQAAIDTTSGSQSSLEVYGNNGVGTDAFMTFHVENDYALYFGLDGGTNKLSVGGWSAGAASYEIYHAGNKPSLATLGYTGATNANYITNNNQLTNGNNYLTTSNDRIFITDTRSADRAPSYYDDRYVQADFTQSSHLGVSGGDFWSAVLTVSPWTVYASTHRQQQLVFAGTNLYRRTASSDSAWGSTYKLWDSGNDGSGSTLDADLLDGQHGSYYAPLASPTFTGSVISPIIRAQKSQTQGNYTTAALWTESYSSTNTGIAFHISGNVGKMLDMRTDGHLYWENGRVWSATSDGSGSGLDADLLDGQQGSYYAPASSIPTNNNQLTNGAGYVIGTGSITESHRVSGNAFATTGSPGSVLEYQQAASITDTKLAPSGDWHNTIRLGHGNPYSYYSNTIALRMTGSGLGDLYTQTISNNNAQGWNKHWHTNNDGSGSGLDADTVDGIQGASFLRSDATDTATGMVSLRAGGNHLGNHEFAASSTATGYSIAAIELRESNYTGSSSATPPHLGFHWGGVVASNISMDSAGAITIRNNPGNAYENFRANNIYANGTNLVWHVGNDGSGSGLDADTVDGIQGASLLRTDAADSIDNNISITQRGQFTTGTSGQNNSTQAGQLNYHYGYQFGGAWTSPFPDLILGYHTGMRFGGYTGYGGCRFYNDHPSRTTTMLFSVGNGDSHVRANNNIYAYTSDIRLKENFRPIENAVDKVKAIGGFIFDWRKDMMDKHEFTPDQEKDDAGLIAQEVQKVMPAAIKRAPFDHDLTKPNQSKSGEDFLTVQYEKMVPLLVEAIKEQQKQIDELKKLLENK